MAYFALALVCLVTYDMLPGPLATLAWMVVAIFVGMGALALTRRMMAYRSGWINGRRQMISSLIEAERRGIDQSEWLEGEIARDFATLGIFPRSEGPDGSHDDL